MPSKEELRTFKSTLEDAVAHNGEGLRPHRIFYEIITEAHRLLDLGMEEKKTAEAWFISLPILRRWKTSRNAPGLEARIHVCKWMISKVDLMSQLA